MRIYPAVNLNTESQMTQSSNSNSLEAGGDTGLRTFQAIYKHQSISRVLYDLSTFFDFNAMILDLEDRKMSLSFTNCNIYQCLEEVHDTGRVRMQYGTNFAVFSRSESSIPALGDKTNNMRQILINRNEPKFKMSVYNGNLFLVLTRIINKSGLPLNLSNQLNSSISLHLDSVKPFEALFYVMKYYRLKIIEKNHVKTIVPLTKESY